MREFEGKRVLVVGLGRSGVAAARFLASEGADVTAADAKGEDELRGALEEIEGLPVKLALGSNDPDLAAGAEMLVASPGVSLTIDVIRVARERGIPVVGELELAARRITKPVIAVTGTNGKTTTTSLIGHLLDRAGIRCCVAGNIGTPLVDVVDEANAADFAVLEVSSFQMETSPSLRAHIAVWLNATADHVDWHGTFENYVASKAKLFTQMSHDGFGIYNASDEAVSQAVIASRCRLVPFDATGTIFSSPGGGNASRAWFEEGHLWVQSVGERPHRFPIEELRLTGSHNMENILAALLAARLAGAPWEPLDEGICTFEGLPHRVQLIAEVDGVRFYDDSKGTNVGATMRAIECFSEPVVLIAGGLGKGADFTGLASFARGRVKRAVLMGEAADEIERSLAGQTRTERASSMKEAVGAARRAAEAGDVVLLSPACASFDMFSDYAERGRAFAEAVKGLVDGRS